MKALRFLSIMIAAALFFSCEKDTPEKEQMVEAEVEFGISHILPDGAKNLPLDPLDDPPTCPEDMDPVRAEIEISEFIEIDDDGNIIYGAPITDYPFEPLVFYLDGKLYTQSIKFPIDEGTTQKFVITKFVIKNAEGHVIMATPNAGSDYANQFIHEDYHLPLTFSVDAFKKTEVAIEVLCFVPDEFDKFGFTWFEIDQYVLREFNFFGNFCIKEAAQYAGSAYDVGNFPSSGFVDAPAIFEIRVHEKDAPENADPLEVISNESWSGVGAPLEIELLMEYGKEYRLELWLLVSLGTETDGDLDFDYAHIYTFYADTEMAQVPLTNIDGVPYPYSHEVLDFVVGGCVYTTPDLQLPPWQVLPNTANVQISYTSYNQGGYWLMKVNSVNPDGDYYDFPTSGDYLGWCGDATTTINQTTYNFNLYSSYYDAFWPAGIPVSVEDLAKVNWLFNNLSDYDGYPALSGMFVEPGDLNISNQQSKDLQHAVWLILGFEYPGNWAASGAGGGAPSQQAIDMAGDASDKGDFIPLPGGYAAVLMVANDNPTAFQLIFTMVDP